MTTMSQSNGQNPLSDSGAVPVIEARGLSVGYNGRPAVHSVDLHVDAGEVVALLGPNGAGKTTLMRGLAGILRPMAGQVLLAGQVTTSPLHKRARSGLGFVMEGRSTFSKLTTLNNLRVGGAPSDRALELFPELAARAGVKAGFLSGGEQQMLTLARAMTREPKILLADELSLGLAPQVVERLLVSLRRAADGGMGVLIVEQHVEKALAVADRGYVLQRGVIDLEGSAEDLRGNVEDIAASYLSRDAGADDKK